MPPIPALAETAPLNEPVVAETVPPDWFVAVVAVLAFPLNAAVIVPALKLPEASRATRVEAVFAFVALVASVTAPEPL